MRLLYSAYSGPVARLRRSSDSAHAEVYVDSFGHATNVIQDDATTYASIEEWLGSATAFVHTWFDQSGNGKDAIQTDVSIQPRVDPVPCCATYTRNIPWVVNIISTEYLLLNLGSMNDGDDHTFIVSGSLHNREQQLLSQCVFSI